MGWDCPMSRPDFWFVIKPSILSDPIIDKDDKQLYLDAGLRKYAY